MITVCFPYFRKIIMQRFGQKPPLDTSAQNVITRSEFEALFAKDLSQSSLQMQNTVRQIRARKDRPQT